MTGAADLGHAWTMSNGVNCIHCGLTVMDVIALQKRCSPMLAAAPVAKEVSPTEQNRIWRAVVDAGRS